MSTGSKKNQPANESATTKSAALLTINPGAGRQSLGADDKLLLLNELSKAKKANETLEAFAMRVFGLEVKSADDTNGKAVIGQCNAAWRWVRQSIVDTDPDTGNKMPKQAPRLKSATSGGGGTSTRGVKLDAATAAKILANFGVAG